MTIGIVTAVLCVTVGWFLGMLTMVWVIDLIKEQPYEEGSIIDERV